MRRFTPHGLRPRSIILNEKYFFKHGEPDKIKATEIEKPPNAEDCPQEQEQALAEQKSDS